MKLRLIPLSVSGLDRVERGTCLWSRFANCKLGIRDAHSEQLG